MEEYIGVDWAGKRWIVVNATNDSISIEAQPSIQAVWGQYRGADQILIDIPIGLPSNATEFPRPCDEQAREFVSGSRYSSVFDVPCRRAVQTSDHETALHRNVNELGDNSLGPQKWGFAERIHEADVFMRQNDPGRTVRESHPEVCFAALTPEGSTHSSKKTNSGQMNRLDILEYHESRIAEAVRIKQDEIEAMSAWKRRIGVGMVDDIIDASVLAYTAMMGSTHEFTQLGGATDAEDLPMEILYYQESK